MGAGDITKMIKKINLGCHTRIRPDYINYDKDNYPGVDAIGTIEDLSRYAGNTFDEIYASNVLEHVSHTETVKVLKGWYRVLAPNGVLKISVPDFDRAIEIYQTNGLCPWVVNFLWGDQIYDGANHYVAFNQESLTRALKEAGFEDISRVEQLPGNQPDECSNLRSNQDGRFVCLNMIAVKGDK